MSVHTFGRPEQEQCKRGSHEGSGQDGACGDWMRREIAKREVVGCEERERGEEPEIYAIKDAGQINCEEDARGNIKLYIYREVIPIIFVWGWCLLCFHQV